MSLQLSIDDAISAGEHGAAISFAKAQRSNPEFMDRASAAILAHLRIVGQCSGEILTEVARAKGAHCADARAFGAVFKRLSRLGLIQTVGFCLRARGHGTAGGRLWALKQKTA